MQSLKSNFKFKILLKNLLENAWKFTAKNPQAIIDFGLTKAEDGQKEE
jgi:hypothetical protein